MEKEKIDEITEIAKVFDSKDEKEKEFMLGVVMGMNVQKKINDIKTA